MVSITKPTQKPSGLKRFLPILYWIPQYQRAWLRPDIIAGLTVVALLIPEGMAYAELAGMPPEAAFLAAPVGLLLYAMFGSSRQLIVAVSSAVAVMSASIVGGFAAEDPAEFIVITSALAVMVGVVAVLFGLLRMGRIARFFSESIMAGFIFGLALVIAMKQLPKIFGFESVDGNFWQRSIDLIQNLPETHLATLVVGITSLILMLLIERYYHRIPAALVTLFYGIIVSVILGLETKGVHVVGEIPRVFPIPTWPDIDLQQWLLLIPGAIGITLVAFAEAIGPARNFAGKYKYSIDENQEMIGLGAANFGAGLFQGFPIGSSLSKSAANDAAGAKSQMSSIVAAGVTLLVGLFLTWMFAPLPEATLGAIVIVAVSGMFKVPAMRRLYTLKKTEFWLATITLLGVLTFHEALAALTLGVILALGVLVYRTSQSRLSVLGREHGKLSFSSVERHPDNKLWPGILILRPDQEVFFVNASDLRQEIRELVQTSAEAVQLVILDLEMTSDLDVDSMETLTRINEDLQDMSVNLVIVQAHNKVRDMLERSGVTEKIGANNIYAEGIADALFDYIIESGELSTEAHEVIRTQLEYVLQALKTAIPKAEGEEKTRLATLQKRIEQAQDAL
jgi:high affinity sulfate transporter 1